MAKPSKPLRIEEIKFLPAEAYFAPRVVRSGTAGHQPERQQEINGAVATIKALRSERRIERLINKTQPKLDTEELLRGGGAALNCEERVNKASSINDEDVCSAALEREIRQAQSLWLNKSGWAEYCDEQTKENILELISLQMRRSLAPSKFAAAIREARRAVTGTTSRDGGYYRPQAHPWKMPEGW